MLQHSKSAVSMTFVCLGITKLECQISFGISFLSLICPCMIYLKEKYAKKKIKIQKIKNALKMIASMFLDTLFLYMRSYDHLQTYIVLIFSYILLMYVFLSPTISCVISFLSFYTCFLLFVCNLLFLFHTKMF